MRADRGFLVLKRRLERAELAHLRAVCAEQAERIDQLEEQADSAWQMATIQQDAYYELLERVPDAQKQAPVIGITRDGEVGLLKEMRDD